MRGSSVGLTGRRARILAAIVEEHVRTAAPVGSKVVREHQDLRVSTATIRNEMCALERAGYIRQPHTSAGRIPADKGYRTYVDGIMSREPPRVEDVAWIRGEYRRTARDPESLYRTTTRVLSRLTLAPAMMVAPPEEVSILTDIRLTPVSSAVVLLTYETQPGGKFECLLESSEPVTASQVACLGEALAQRYCGRGTGALSLCTPESIEEETGPHTVAESLLNQVKTAVEGDRQQRVYVDGAAFSLDYPEYREISHLRPVMQALDEERIVRRLLRPAARKRTVTITIGREQEVRELRRCSLVARSYGGRPGSGVGAIGVIGPTRMDYRQMAVAVETVAEEVGEALGEGRSGQNNAG